MKKTRLYLITLAMLCLNITIAQNYKQPYNVTDKGQIENEKGIKLGWIEKDGTVKDANGKSVGKIDKNEMFTTTGKKMAEISAEGTVTSTEGKVLYTISNPNESGICKILDGTGKEVGSVHRNYKQQGASALHCLNGQK